VDSADRSSPLLAAGKQQRVSEQGAADEERDQADEVDRFLPLHGAQKDRERSINGTL
jgi:hypothetical protein